MPNSDNFQLILNKLIALENKFTEIESIIKVLNLWAKENDYELIPIINILNSKMDDTAEIINGKIFSTTMQ